MPSQINASNSGFGGIVSTGDSSGVLQLQTAGTTAITIDTSQNVGIGTTTPADKFVVAGSGNTVSITDNGSIEIQRASGDAFIDFKASAAVDYDTRIQSLGSGSSAALGFNTNSTERMRIDSNGNLQVGLTTGGAKINAFQSSNGQCINIGDGNAFDGSFYGVLQITRAPAPGDNRFHICMIRNGNIIGGLGYVNNSNTMFVGNSGGTNANGMTLTNSATSWGSQSDERVKNIHGNIENAVEKIGEWRTVYFNYKIDEEGSKQRVGLIAQDVEKTAPEVVDSIGDEQETLQVRYTEVIPLLVAAIKEQQTIINDLKARIETLESK